GESPHAHRMHGDGAGGEASGRAHRYAPGTSQHGGECQREQQQDGAAEEISLHKETDHRERVHCRDGQRDLDDPGPGRGAIEVERQVHRASILWMKSVIRDGTLADVGRLARIRAAVWGTEQYWHDRIRGYMRGELHAQQALAPRVVLVAED